MLQCCSQPSVVDSLMMMTAGATLQDRQNKWSPRSPCLRLNNDVRMYVWLKNCDQLIHVLTITMSRVACVGTVPGAEVENSPGIN